MNGLLSVKDAAIYCQNLPVNYFSNQMNSAPDPLSCACRRSAFSSRRRFGSVDGDLGIHYA